MDADPGAPPVLRHLGHACVGPKPGMQRDLLAAFWLLFDEFEIGNGDPPEGVNRAPGQPTPPAATEGEKAKPRNNNAKSRRRP